MPQQKSITLGDIASLDIRFIEKGLEELSREYPVQFSAGKKASLMVLEYRDTSIYFALVRGNIPSIEEGLRVDYACILKEMDKLDLIGTY